MVVFVLIHNESFSKKTKKKITEKQRVHLHVLKSQVSTVLFTDRMRTALYNYTDNYKTNPPT